jgi:hypothetical protein
MKKKEKIVTKEISDSALEIVNSHRKNSEDFVDGIKHAGHYLKNNVESKGLFAYVTTIINSSHANVVEKIVCSGLYEDLNKADYDVKDDS